MKDKKELSVFNDVKNTTQNYGSTIEKFGKIIFTTSFW